MKKIASLALTLILVCCAFFGCVSDLNISVSDEGITEFDKEDITDGFEFKWKEYYYNGNPHSDIPEGNVLILNATNTTDTNYSIKIKVTFFDENGKEAGKKTKNIRDFPAGYNRYVVFDSCPDYSTYLSELVLTEYTGDSYADHISFKFGTQTEKFLVDTTDPLSDIYNELVARTSFKFDCPIPEMYVTYDVVLFDNKGEIYIIFGTGEKTYPHKEGGHNYSSTNRFLKEDDRKNKDELPDELTGDVQVIFSMDNLKVYN